MLRADKISVIVLLALCGWGCKKVRKLEKTGYIIGPTNDILQPKIDENDASNVDILSLVRSSALITTRLADGKIKFCSGVLIDGEKSGSGPLRILTNHHCFAVPASDDKASAKIYNESCRQTTVYLGFSPSLGLKPFESGCEVGTLRSSFEGDLAIFALSKPPPEEHQPLALWPDPTVPENTKAIIIHYPDIKEHMAEPPGQPIKLPTAAITEKNCEVLGPFSENEWELDRTLAYSSRHTCDLIHGSSGSALIEPKTKTILGINWGGIKIGYESGIRTDNVATGIMYVSAFVAGQMNDDIENRTRARQAEQAANTVPAIHRKKSTEKESTAGEVFKSCGAIGTFSQGLAGLLIFMLPFSLLICRKDH